MRIIVAGSRSITDYSVVKSVIEATLKQHYLPITELVSGMAKGVDLLAVKWAKEVGIPIHPFPAEWQNFSEPCVKRMRKDGTMYNVLAGFNRNLQMALYAEALIAIWTGTSRGTENMLKIAEEYGLKIFSKVI
jgi:hypothetical protein